MANCHRHPRVSSTGICRECQGEFCEDCLVYAFGTGRAPYCVDCAVAAAGRRGGTQEIDLRGQRISPATDAVR